MQVSPQVVWFTQISVSCLLDYGEPAGKSHLIMQVTLKAHHVFDELGLKSWNGTVGTGKLLTHVVFHPTKVPKQTNPDRLYS